MRTSICCLMISRTKELKVFEEVFTKLIKISLWNTKGTQFLSKNPPHTGRVKELVKMFPNAKFIYLMRNPYTVFEFYHAVSLQIQSSL